MGNKMDAKEIESLYLRIIKLVDNDLVDADRGNNLEEARRILAEIQKVDEEVRDVIVDIEDRLANHRAIVLSSLFGFLAKKDIGVYEIKTGRPGYYLIETNNDWDGDHIEVLRQYINSELIERHIPSEMIIDNISSMSPNCTILRVNFVI